MTDFSQFNLTPEQIDQLMLYLSRLQQWNKKLNLTAITNTEEMITRHLMDSLAVAPFISATRILDVGTGAGLPGLPLAVAQPEKNYVLLDSRGKKIHFLRQIIAELGCKNVEAVHARVEEFNTLPLFDGIICRAVGPVKEIVTATTHLQSPNGKWFFMKGPNYHAELAGLEYPYKIEKLSVPGLNEERVLIVVDNTQH